jgi:hypothetical protein
MGTKKSFPRGKMAEAMTKNKKIQSKASDGWFW